MKKLGTLPVLICAGMLILDGKCAMEAGAQGVELCLKTVIPSLFPFLFLSSVLTHQLWGGTLRGLNPLCRSLGITEGGQALLLSAFLGGYPAGAQTVAECYRSGKLTKTEAENLLTFCSNAGPAFLFGMTAVQFPGLIWVFSIWLIQILSAVLTGLLLSRPAVGNIRLAEKNPNLSQSLNTAVRAMGVICGWIILFRILLGFGERWVFWYLPDWVRVTVSGLTELINGCVMLGRIPSLPLRFVICNVLLSFGGICVAMQTASVTQGLSLRPYLRGKLVQTGLAGAVSSAFVLPKAGIPLMILLFCLLFPAIMKKRGGKKALGVV